MWLNRRNTFTGRLYRCVRASQAGSRAIKTPCRLSQACMALDGSSPALLPEHDTPSSMAMMRNGNADVLLHEAPFAMCCKGLQIRSLLGRRSRMTCACRGSPENACHKHTLRCAAEK